MLPKRTKNRWVKALRSGKYRQAHNSMCVKDMRGNESFCCLGVLAHLEGADPKDLRKHNGLSHPTITPLLPRATRQRLVDMNDLERETFTQIATYIEKNL